MKQQARNVAMHFQEQPVRPRFLLRDNDTKYTKEFDAILELEGVEVKKHTPVSPNLNAVAERFVQTISQECLDHFLVFGEAHLRHLCTEFLAYYHQDRPHQGLGKVLLRGMPEVPAELARVPLSEVSCRERLGGLLKSYSRGAGAPLA
jgi:putative transposase